jgi:hypothetical protein
MVQIKKGQGIFIATNSFTFEECKMLALILSNKYGFRTSVIKTGHFISGAFLFGKNLCLY